MWKFMAAPIDQRYARFKSPLLKEVAGIVVDLGSGLGSNLKQVLTLQETYKPQKAYCM